MRVLCLLFLSFLSVTAVRAQIATNMSDVQVVKKQWQMETYNPELDGDPFFANKQARQTDQDVKDNMRANKERVRQNLPMKGAPPPVQKPDNANLTPSDVYTYKVKFKNAGAKTIKSIVWAYMFFDPSTKQEVGFLKFENKVKINPNQTDEVSASTVYAPSKSVNVKQTGKKLRDQYLEKIVILKIEYADGTLWEIIPGSK